MAPFTAARLFVVLAVIVFALATFGVSLGGIQLVPAGLALLGISYLVP